MIDSDWAYWLAVGLAMFFEYVLGVTGWPMGCV